jgi:hypothetical protein
VVVEGVWLGKIDEMLVLDKGAVDERVEIMVEVA